MRVLCGFFLVGLAWKYKTTLADFEDFTTATEMETSVATPVTDANAGVNCTVEFHDVDLTIKTTVNDIFLSWEPLKYSDICGVSYDIHMVKEKPTDKVIPYYRQENSTQHKIGNLDSCTSYNVSVVPSNVDLIGNVPVHTVSTLPEEVTDVHVEVNGVAATLYWTPPQNTDCIESYRVTINKSNFNTADSSINIDHTPYCEDISITPMTYDYSSGKTVHLIKPGPVQDLNSYPEASSITVSWLPPLNNSCVEEYLVRLGDKVSFTKWSEFTFENLTSCTKYEMQVFVKSTDNTIGSYLSVVSETLPPQEIGPPENFSVEYENKALTLNWEPPKNAQNCNISYSIKLMDNNGKVIITEETSENLQTINFNSWVGCLEYTIILTPQIATIQKSNSVELKKKIEKVRDAPTCQVLQTAKDSAIFECNIGSFETNLCSLQNLQVTCTPTNFIDKIRRSKKPKNIVKKYDFKENPHNSRITMKIDNLAVFTNYTCISFLTNSAGQSPTSSLISFNTQEDLPSAPQLVEIVNLTNISFSVKWQPPNYIQGILVKYQISIEYEGPTYFVPQDCFVQRSKNILIDVDHLQNEYSFNGALPSSRYSVYVQAITGAGPGEKSTGRDLVTLAGVPEEPRNVDFVINKTEGADFDFNVVVSWWYPCYTNGFIKHFQVDLFDSKKMEQNIFIPNEEDAHQLNFSSKFKLMPALDYVISVTTIAEGNMKSNPVKLRFTSPETYPAAPVNIQFANVTKNTFVIIWNKPSITNGVLTDYTINIINEGPLHKVPKDCIQEAVNHKFVQPSSLTSFKFQVGLPNYRYKVTVAAATKVGYGLPSEPISVETLQSESEEVRDARLLLTTLHKEQYDVKATVIFKYPCNTNGPFKYFLVNVFGSRTNFPIHKNKVNVEGIINQENIVVIQVLPAHNYIINVEVVTENYHSESTSLGFSSPAGIPVAIKEDTFMLTPKSQNLTFTQVVLNRNMFSQMNGPILYYAIIVAPNLDEIVPSYGIWDGINWPQVQYGFSKANVIVPYQASQNFWNPFDGNDRTSYTFIIGDTSLSKTNVPLQPNVAYKVFIRGFTQNGYSDSDALDFVVPGIDDSNVALIVGLIFGIIGTIILIVIALICKRRERWLAKKDSIKLVPLTPLSVSIENFPDYYNKFKNSNEMLKEEFMLLTRKSSEIVYPTYEALRPENKKKNRYNNVLPYDKTRVKLENIEEGSDYINASYVQGYSGEIEYIATQGPLEHTCQDFWKMVLQENCSLIVMIAQFVELNKQKCFKYFPDNHENMELDNGIAIRCCTELSFKSYTVRTLLVQKDLHQWTITHLQYTEWPDFGCPEGTQTTLEFSQLIRKHAEQNGDPIIVHCSAGVGRTGTLIALDILFQALSNNDEIDIFGTVLNLRRDRKNMVQTEKQYLYIHECISIAITNPEYLQNKSNTPQEAIYENVEEIKMESMSNGMSESAF